MNRTDTKEIGGIRYCVYCGNESVHEVDYYNHGREEDHYETCDCEELKQVIDKQDTISRITRDLAYFKDELIAKNSQKFNRLFYESAMKELKERYEQD